MKNRKKEKGERKNTPLTREILSLIPENVSNPLSLSAPASLSDRPFTQFVFLNGKKIKKLIYP
ncbi:MAG: hypothetical protein PHF18_13630 [Methanosarcina sp.]|uniref:hypothetical protein n=1 Tax=Methanosarcina sp. TaxID=2213 RepID=UPI00260D911A|nr:hypothetical protein [Methanosarcina sp.]MDD3247867.1 hypothetical protein [Methanosarcina sp.]